MERAGIAGDLLPWRDVLHEGPVPDLPRRRAAARARGVPGHARAARRRRGRGELRARDERLAAAVAEGEPVVLWFEHDLYDQLQLIQILAGLPDRPAHVELICVGSFPGRPGFAGLGELEPDELASLWPVRTRGHARARAHRARGVGRRARRRPARARPRGRHAGRAPAVPRARAAAAARGAARRPRRPRPHRAPAARSGRAPARARACDAFLASMAAEEAPFMGDTIAFDRLDGLARAGRATTARSLLTDGRRGGARRPRRPRRADRLRPLARRPARARRRTGCGAGTPSERPRRSLTR